MGKKFIDISYRHLDLRIGVKPSVACVAGVGCVPPCVGGVSPSVVGIDPAYRAWPILQTSVSNTQGLRIYHAFVNTACSRRQSHFNWYGYAKLLQDCNVP